MSTQVTKTDMRLIFILGGLGAFVTLSIDIYLPSLPSIASDFGASMGAVQHTMAAYFVGLALGQLVYGPISDRIGRRVPILVGIALYVAASLACALAPSIEVLIAGRFVQAFGACAALVVSRAVVKDLYNQQDTARVLSLLTLFVGVAPILAPSVGAVLLELGSWRSIFAVLCGFGMIVGLSTHLGLAETRSAATATQARAETPWIALLVVMRNRQALGYVLCGALNVACLLAYMTAAPALLMTTFGLSPAEFAWIFAVNAIGLVGMNQVNRLLLRSHSVDLVLRTATVVAIPLGALLVAGATVNTLWSILIPLFLVLATYGLVAANAAAGALSADPLRAGSASALAGSASFAAGALASAAASFVHDGTALPLALTMLGALVLSALSLFTLTRSGSG
jgi:DHA1 family bicyclomycin/chloramphenicol resistance-like MFS transporter